MISPRGKNKQERVKVANHLFIIFYFLQPPVLVPITELRPLSPKLSRNINMDLGVSLKQGPQLIKSVITLYCKNTSSGGGAGGGVCGGLNEGQ